MDPDALLDQIDNELQDMDFVLEPNIQNILDKKSLKWIFVGGKGGVGKTTTSCSIAVSLAKVRESVLIISTDPAHNLSDAFGQQFSKEPCLVDGFKNLYAMEVDPTIEMEDNSDLLGEGQEGNMFKDFALAIPGIDEAAGFAEVMKLVQSMKFETIVFDTAPTGHTLRLLAFPSVLDKGLGKLMSIKNKIGGLFSTFSSMIPGLGAETPEQLTDKLEGTKKVIEEVNKQFKNPDLTTFVCVCIPEFLSLYETERLVQELTKFEIDVNNIVINQVLYPDAGAPCGLCNARSRMQKKYVDQIQDLYEDFHIVKLPLLREEVRGTKSLQEFAKLLLTSSEEDKRKLINERYGPSNTNQK